MKNTIMLKILFLVLPLLVVAQEGNYTLLLVDKSGSMKVKNPRQDKYIYQIIKSACATKTASVEVRFVNETTNSVMNKKVFVYTVPEFNAELYPKDEVELQRQLFESKIKREKKDFTKKIVTFINSYDATAQWTELLSGIVGIARLNKKEARVYFFTDGIESSKYRDMTKGSFKSEQEAVMSAKADVVKLRKKFQLPKTLSGIQQIRFVIPLDMQANSDVLQFLEVYWKEVYRGFGFENVFFETL
ncbi:hypothetical protein ACQY1Q_13610 [Tenacibaculum sp. TC6]|uniref:hypothetical protein n=1 Tax=Tenacibaculum sp. TC6 TaxID=3423223 RepID=UPI003D35E96B